MIPTPIGAIVVLVGIFLLFRPPAEALVFVVISSLFAGASALDAVALGHSSIPPNIVALGFLLLRVSRKDFRKAPLPSAIRLNMWLLIYCIYGAASAFVLPRIFAGRVMVMSLQQAKSLSPLFPSSQNITQALYLIGTGACAVAASLVTTKASSAKTLVSGLIIAAWIHVLTGMIDAVASAAHINGVFDFLRNGAYAQLDQEVSSYHRISGMTPEPSAYAALGIVFTAFTMELWLRGVDVWRTGLTAAATALMLVLSTSTTGYLFLGGYSALLLARFVLIPGAIGWRKGAVLVSSVAVSAAGVIILVLSNPAISRQMSDIFLTMTVSKAQSSSGLERAMWARQGWDLFLQTRGLGVGLGSFRSSNFFTGVLGAMGPACLVILLCYFVQVFAPARLSTYKRVSDARINIGAAAAWVPVLILIPATFTAPSADPGILTALFCGTALAARSKLLAGWQGTLSEELPVGVRPLARPDRLSGSPG